ncbi:MAG: DNA-formamidopyrimidine glycosylase [Candidatus Omnitrophica bacterium]|nr:DNA-formamidopyrimidine glycosylase [Candidatus Omnitrophota bacterium]
MPELPEVETIKRDLEKTIVGKKITEVSVHNAAVIKEPSVKEFKKRLAGQTIKGILRRAKLLVLELSNGQDLTVHLKMTGQLVYPGGSPKSRVSFYLSNGEILDFNDQRLFGELRLVDDWKKLKFVQGLGPEPFDISLELFKKMLLAKKTKIKPLLMDQTFVSGIGNLYAAECLFRSRIRPERPANSLTGKEAELLFRETKAVLTEAIRYGGSSVDDYVRVSGKPGNYVEHHKVYGRQGKLCLVCKTKIHKIFMAGRGTCFCPKCQK